MKPRNKVVEKADTENQVKKEARKASLEEKTIQPNTELRGTKEIAEIMTSFEKLLKTDYAGYIGREVQRLDQHGRLVEGYPKDHFYTNTEVNHKFKMFLAGYMTGRRGDEKES